MLLCAIVVSCSDSSDSSSLTPTPDPNPTGTDYELANNVVELDGELLEYVSFVKGDTLVYDSNTPSGKLPKIGEIVLVSQTTDVFPYGFLGKVVKISPDGAVITEAAALDEAFTYLNVEGTYDLEPADVQYKNRASSVETYRINENFSVQIGRFLTGTVELGVSAQLGFKLHIDKRNNKNIRSGYVDVVLENYVGLETVLAFGEKDDDDDKNEPKQLGNGIKLGKIIVGAVIIEPVLQPYIKPQLEGYANVSCYGETRNVRKIRMDFDGDRWTMAPVERDDADFEFKTNPDINIGGSAFLGPGLALEFRLYGNKNIKVALNAQAGIEASGEISLSTDKDDVYDTLKDSNLSLEFKGGVGLEASAKIFLMKLKWEHMFEKVWNQWNWYVFPSFTNGTLSYNEDEILASTYVGQNLLWEQEVGLALYDDDECIQLSEPLKYKKEENFANNPMQQVFEGISFGERNDYSVWSYVKWGDIYIKCKQIIPAKKIKRLQIKEVTSEYSDVVDLYTFAYKNDSIDEIVWTESEDSRITYKFNYLEDGVIKVVGTATGESTTYTLNLNDKGYIKSSYLLYQDDEGSNSISYEFDYDEEGHMTYMKCSEGNEIWRIVYENSDATSVTLNGGKSSSISYGNKESIGDWILYEWMTGVDIDEMEFFGLLGMLGKPSKHLPSVTNIIDEGCVINYNWTLDSYGYPDRLVLNEGGSADYIMDFTWE